MAKSKPIRILYMEDDTGLARLVQKRFERIGYVVDIAPDGEKGLALLERGNYDIVVLDQNMPGYNGLEILRIMALRGPLPPTIMITGAGNEEIAVKALKLGAYDYIVKEVGSGYLGLLPSVIERALQKRRLTEEKQQAEEALRESEERFRTIFETAQDSIFIKNRSLKYTQVNPAMARLYGLPVSKLIGRTDGELFGKKTAAHIKEIDSRVLGGEIVEEETTKKVNGIPHIFHVIKVPMRDNSGEIIGLCGIARDITERKRLDEEKEKIQALLLQSQKMEAIGRLAGGVAHEFNNLLTGIMGFSELLLARIDDNSPLRKDIEAIKKASKRAALLSSQLLAFSRSQKALLTVLDLNVVVNNIEKMLRRLIGEHIKLVTHLDPSLEHVKSDPGLMEQLIVNLAVNARDAMPEGGKLTLKTENIILSAGDCKDILNAHPGKFVCLSVTDTGIGMNQEVIHRMFEPFFGTKEVGKGSGLGLSVVYGIIKQHEGWINVETEPGQGSTFRIYLPVSSEKPVKKSEETISSTSFNGNGESILVVEDEEIVLKLATRVLSENGYVVFEAANAKEALDIYNREKGKFNLVFTDVVMPGENGLQLVDKLLTLNPELRVLFSSGYSDDKSHRDIIIERGLQFLQKPYTPTELLQVIKEVIEVA